MDEDNEVPTGEKIVWARQDRPAIEGAPYRLPGVVVDALPDGWVIVAWVDKRGWQTPDAVYEMASMEALSDTEFERAVRELREADWPGLPTTD